MCYYTTAREEKMRNAYPCAAISPLNSRHARPADPRRLALSARLLPRDGGDRRGAGAGLSSIARGDDLPVQDLLPVVDEEAALARREKSLDPGQARRPAERAQSARERSRRESAVGLSRARPRGPSARSAGCRRCGNMRARRAYRSGTAGARAERGRRRP
jgi:hypothetical protein